jgi:hypothetical protein
MTIVNDPVPGTPIADALAAAGTTNDHPNPAEKRLANPADPDSVTSIRYRPDGTVMPKAEELAEGDLGPEGMPAVSPDDAPFSQDDIPSGWNRFPTAEEVDWLNGKYPAAFDDAGLPVDPNAPIDMTGTFLSFTAASPTTVTADGEDTAALSVGDIVTLEALTGTTEAMAAVNGVNAAVLTVNPTTLDLDLSAVDTENLTADYTR